MAEPAPSIKDRLTRIRGIGPAIGRVLDVQARYDEIGGAVLANALALQAFLSLFPLVLVGIAVLGFLSSGDEGFADEVIRGLGLNADDALAEQLRTAIERAEQTRRTATVLGFVGLLLAAMGVIGVMETALDRVWQTTRSGVASRVAAVVWLLGTTAIVGVSVAAGVVTARLPWFLAPLTVALGLAVNVVLFTWTYGALGRAPIGWRDRLPGALVAAVGFELLKLIGTVFVPRLVASSSALYGSLGAIFALLAWLNLVGRLFITGAVVNVVAFEHGHGSVSVETRAPRFDTEVAVAANRSGAVIDRRPVDEPALEPEHLPA